MKIVLVGAGGYGRLYTDLLLDSTDPEIELQGVVEKYPDSCARKNDILAKNIPIYETLEDFYAEHTADLAIIATPVFLHREQSICCVEHGSNVLCEKPASTTTQDVHAMIEAEKRTGKFIAIGFQWSFAEAEKKLKQDILNGVLGKPVRMKTIISWPRGYAYYNRGCGWAGRIKKDGIILLDSIASNACAHFIENMFFLLGDRMDSAASPASVEAECLRANKIETFDTCILRMKTKDNVPLYFAATHASSELMEPYFEYEFENAVIRYDKGKETTDDLVAEFRDGTKKVYGKLNGQVYDKTYDCIRAVKNGTRPISTAETALSHSELIEKLYQHAETAEYPEEKKVYTDEGVSVNGLFEKLKDSYDKMAMFSENGVSYAKKAEFTWDE